MNYLITGATGFIGPYLVKKLIAQGDNCRCLIRRQSDISRLSEHRNVEFVRGDITRVETLKGITDDRDFVIHMATLGHMSNYRVPEEMFEAVNVLGTLNIMREAERGGVKKVVHCSTVAAMGICDEIPSTEKTQCLPHHPYGRSKLKAENEVLKMVREANLPAVIIRFSMVYGPGDRRDILKLTRLAKKGLYPKVGHRPKLTPLIHVQDAVDGLLLACDKGRPGEIYLITNRQSEPFDKLREIIQQALGIKKRAVYIPEWAALTLATLAEKTFSLIGKSPPVSRKNIESTLADRVFSVDKAARELGFNPKIAPSTGLYETVKWYIQKRWV